MIYQHRFKVNAPLSRVAEFHRRADSMAAITPPPIFVRLQSAPNVLGEGDLMSFTLWFGPLPVHWVASIESVSSHGFTDRQLQGPLNEWVHQHSYKPVDEHTTEVIDEITLRLRTHVFWGLFGLGMRLGLPVLFAFRAWKTKRVLT